MLVRVSVFLYKGPEHMLELHSSVLCLCCFLSVCVFGLKPKLIHSVGEVIRSRRSRNLVAAFSGGRSGLIT